MGSAGTRLAATPDIAEALSEALNVSNPYRQAIMEQTSHGPMFSGKREEYVAWKESVVLWLVSCDATYLAAHENEIVVSGLPPHLQTEIKLLMSENTIWSRVFSTADENMGLFGRLIWLQKSGGRGCTVKELCPQKQNNRVTRPPLRLFKFQSNRLLRASGKWREHIMRKVSLDQIPWVSHEVTNEESKREMCSSMVEILGLGPAPGRAALEHWLSRKATGAQVVHYSGVAATMVARSPQVLAPLQQLTGRAYNQPQFVLKVEKHLWQCSTAEIFDIAERECAKAEAKEVGKSLSPRGEANSGATTQPHYCGRGRGRGTSTGRGNSLRQSATVNAPQGTTTPTQPPVTSPTKPHDVGMCSVLNKQRRV